MKGIVIFVMIIMGTTIGWAQDPDPPACDAATEEQNKALAKRFYENVWFANKPEVVDELVADEYILHDIGDQKGVTEKADMQKEIAAFFWDNGKMSGSIDYQVAECDLVATRWQWKYQPETWWMRIMGGSNQIPIINVFRFENGKIVEIWNHRHDIDTAQGNIPFVIGMIFGSIPALFFLIIGLLLWRQLRKRDLQSAN